MSSDSWCTIESDPGVFTELLEDLGVVGVELQELWSLDVESLAQCGTIYGFIFLFQWESSNTTITAPTTIDNDDQHQELPTTTNDLFFAHQVVPNACATQALLSILMNNCSEHVELGPILSEFKSFTASFPPTLKGEAIGASVDIQRVHNSFARHTDGLLVSENGDRRKWSAAEDEAVYHFVAYIPNYQNGKVYELDGLQQGPKVIGEIVHGEDWKHIASNAIQERMKTSSSSSVNFNLMAMVRDVRLAIQEQLAMMDTTNTASNDSSDCKESSAYVELLEQLEEQNRKRIQWKKENQRRKHNYVPLCIQWIKELARQGKLETLVSDAKEKARERKRMKKSKE